jgi:acetoacetyl-CoA synthetase
LLQHLKEHQLHGDIRPDDRIFYFTTCGWMMWNWLVSALASGATLLLYDGSPFVRGRRPTGTILFDYADAERMTHFGTSAKFIDAIAKAASKPRRDAPPRASAGRCSRPAALWRRRASTTSIATSSPIFCWRRFPAAPTSFRASRSGSPILPVYRGELQCRGLGMAVDVFDDEGRPIPAGQGERGELVCTAPFPAMPVGFWNDPDGAKYHAAYFERFPNVWCHGDFVELTANEGMIIYGRSDAVLNPGGVRIGTAEIYRQVEQLPEVSSRW